MKRTRTLIGTVAVAVAVAPAGCGSASSTLTPAPVIRAFARRFGAYLDGQLPARSVHGVTAQARAQLGQILPRRNQMTHVSVRSVHPASLESMSQATLRVGRYALPVGEVVRRAGAGYAITRIVPADLDSILQGPGRPGVGPHGSAGARHAARTFLAGYLPWVYGRGRAAAIHALTPQLQRQLRGRSLAQGPGAPNLHPLLVAIGMRRAHVGWSAAANISDAERTYDLNLGVVRSRGRWEVNRVDVPN